MTKTRPLRQESEEVRYFLSKTLYILAETFRLLNHHCRISGEGRTLSEALSIFISNSMVFCQRIQGTKHVNVQVLPLIPQVKAELFFLEVLRVLLCSSAACSLSLALLRVVPLGALFIVRPVKKKNFTIRFYVRYVFSRALTQNCYGLRPSGIQHTFR